MKWRNSAIVMCILSLGGVPLSVKAGRPEVLPMFLVTAALCGWSVFEFHRKGE